MHIYMYVFIYKGFATTRWSDPKHQAAKIWEGALRLDPDHEEVTSFDL